MFKLRTTLLAVLLVALSAYPLLAGPLKHSQIPSDVKWVVHGDLEQLQKTKIRELVLAELMEKGLQEKMDAIEKMVGFDPTKDLKSVTLYGTVYEERQGIVLVQCDYDRVLLMGMLQLDAAHKESSYKKHAIHAWDDSPANFGCFYDEQLVVDSFSRVITPMHRAPTLQDRFTHASCLQNNTAYSAI